MLMKTVLCVFAMVLGSSSVTTINSGNNSNSEVLYCYEDPGIGPQLNQMLFNIGGDPCPFLTHVEDPACLEEMRDATEDLLRANDIAYRQGLCACHYQHAGDRAALDKCLADNLSAYTNLNQLLYEGFVEAVQSECHCIGEIRPASSKPEINVKVKFVRPPKNMNEIIFMAKVAVR